MNKLITNKKGSYYIEMIIIFPFAILLMFVGLFSLLNMQLRNQMNEVMKNTIRELATANTYYKEDIRSKNALEIIGKIFGGESNDDDWKVEYVRIYFLDNEGNEDYVELIGYIDGEDTVPNWEIKEEQNVLLMNEHWKIGNEIEVKIWKKADKGVQRIIGGLFTINFFDKSFSVVEDRVEIISSIMIENQLFN